MKSAHSAGQQGETEMGRTLALAALTLGLALSPAAAAQTSDPAPKIESFITDYMQTLNRHDATALANFFAEDAVFVPATGVPLNGRDAIEKFYANFFKQNPSETAKATEIHALGDNAWGIGEYDIKLTGTNGPAELKGHWAAIYVPVGDEWKVRMLSAGPNAQPAPMPVSGSSTSK
jgi:uncharacterized protein (TIGR02246 family)